MQIVASLSMKPTADRECWHSLTHTTPFCLQVEEEDERKKKDSERAHEVELLKFCELQLLSFL